MSKTKQYFPSQKRTQKESQFLDCDPHIVSDSDSSSSETSDKGFYIVNGTDFGDQEYLGISSCVSPTEILTKFFAPTSNSFDQSVYGKDLDDAFLGSFSLSLTSETEDISLCCVLQVDNEEVLEREQFIPQSLDFLSRAFNTMKENETMSSLETLKSEMERKNIELETEVKNMKQKLAEIESQKYESLDSQEDNNQPNEIPKTPFKDQNEKEEKFPKLEKDSNADRILKEDLNIYVKDLSPQIQKENFQKILNSENVSNEETRLKEALHIYQKDLPSQFLKEDFQEHSEPSVPLQEETLDKSSLNCENHQEDEKNKELKKNQESETTLNKTNLHSIISSDDQSTNTNVEIQKDKSVSSENKKFLLKENILNVTSNLDDQNTKSKDKNNKDSELHTLEIKNDKSETSDEEFPCIKYSDNKKFPLELVSAINIYRNKRGVCNLLHNDEMSEKCLNWATFLSKTDQLIQDSDSSYEVILCVEKLYSENTKVLPQKIVDVWFNNQKVKKVRKFTDPRDEPKSKRIGNLACPFTRETSECGASIVYTHMKKAYIVAYFN